MTYTRLESGANRRIDVHLTSSVAAIFLDGAARCLKVKKLSGSVLIEVNKCSE